MPSNFSNKGKANIIRVFYLTNIPKMLLSQHVINVENCEWAILHYFFTVSLQNLTCVLHLECSSIWTNHISTIGQPPVASSYHIRPHRSSSFKKKKNKKKKPSYNQRTHTSLLWVFTIVLLTPLSQNWSGLNNCTRFNQVKVVWFA